jgi:hypothetical protein
MTQVEIEPFGVSALKLGGMVSTWVGQIEPRAAIETPHLAGANLVHRPQAKVFACSNPERSRT